MNFKLANLLPQPVDRISWMAILIVACFLAVLLLGSQSRASYPTYFLALVMLFNWSAWRDVFRVDLARWILVLLGWLAFSAFWSQAMEIRDVATVWIRALLVFCFVIAFAECQLRGQIQRWMAPAIALCGFAVILAALVNFYLTSPLDGRLNGLGQLDSHVIAALVFGAIILFLLHLLFVTNHSGLRIALCMAIAVSVYAIYLSDSRNAWFSVGFGMVVFLLTKKVADPRAFLLTLTTLVLVAAVSLLALVANDAVRELLLPRGDSYRLEIWGQVFSRVWAENPIFGLGILTVDDVKVDGFLIQHPHNMYLAVFHQGGLIALALYLIVIVSSVATLLKNYSNADAKLGLAILGLALSAHLLDGHELVDKVGSSWFLIWLPVGISLGLRWRHSLGGR